MPRSTGTTTKKKTTKRKVKKNLVIVESPSKAKTIEKYLGSRYKVMASLGHIRDLPKSKMGVDVENNYEPHYISIRGKGDVIKELCKEAKLSGEFRPFHIAYTSGRTSAGAYRPETRAPHTARSARIHI